MRTSQFEVLFFFRASRVACPSGFPERRSETASNSRRNTFLLIFHPDFTRLLVHSDSADVSR
jgi:hypothetical protein